MEDTPTLFCVITGDEAQKHGVGVMVIIKERDVSKMNLRLAGGRRMLTFNSILRDEGIDPKNVRLVRHRDARASANCTPYDLWRAGDGRLEFYQRIQKRKPFDVGDLLATFVATPANDTLFIGLFRVDGLGIAPAGTIDPVIMEDRAGLNLDDIERDKRLSEYEDHLIIDWGKGFRTGCNVPSVAPSRYWRL